MKISERLSRPRFSRLRTTCQTVFTLAVLVASVGPAMAEEPNYITEYDGWKVYKFRENAADVCYMASIPGKQEGNYTKRGDAYALITHRPAEDSFDVFSFTAGYDYKDNSDVSLTIGKQHFTLFTHGDTAWAQDLKTEKTLVEAIRQGETMVIKGTSKRGTETTDTIDLRGTQQAYNRISKECNKPRK